ncbi:nucleoside diphosphate kinase 6 isoform X3 [Pelodiscus sinensis]|uniref:nucleoside diphosphate kinase 6 isoform X3 n=1 Tax=Pelodiscus sinensis TaxID=13735 RepID=UPI003F6CEE4E
MGAVLRAARPLQLTLAVVKPDAVAHPLVLAVRGPGLGHERGARRRHPAPPRLPPRGRLGPPEASAVHETILNNKFLIVRNKELVWRREDSQRFYQEHSGSDLRELATDSCSAFYQGRFFYQRLVEFMASGPMRAYILAHEDAVALWRSLMGPTKVYQARNTAPDSIRGAYGLTDTRNTTHGSDADKWHPRILERWLRSWTVNVDFHSILKPWGSFGMHQF